MNQAELLDQFVVEARECLEAIGERLLEVERRPDDTALLNDLFRSVHTLKGNCGLFEFKPLETVMHAGEDLLDRVRNHTLPYSGTLGDALLEAMDFAGQMIDQIERHGRIEAGATAQATPLAQALRALIPAAGQVQAAAPAAPVMVAPAAATTSPPPDWLSRLPYPVAGAVALRYTPEPECFFKGEDPWRLVCTAPGLLHVDVAALTPWPRGSALESVDCYQCNLDLVLLSDATLDEVQAHFRCVPEQVECLLLADSPQAGALAPAADTPAAGAPAADATDATAADATAAAATDEAFPPSAAEHVVQQRARQLWAGQLALLAANGLPAGVVAGVASSLRGLLCAWPGPASEGAVDALQKMPQPFTVEALRQWARQHAPGAAQAGNNAARDAAANADLATAPVASTISTASSSRDSAMPAGLNRPAMEEATSGAPGQRVLKVSQEKIDRLMDLIGEMVVAKNTLPYLAQRAEDVFGQRELAREIKAQYAVINRIAEDMQGAIMQVRMLPVGTVFQRFGRLVRDISKKLGKEVNLVIEGEETEADKNVIESLADPLIHILRNSLDHGVELPDVRRAAGKTAVGTIRIQARQESDRVLIEISDDGAGVNAERVRSKAIERGLIPADRADTLSHDDAVQLIFLPGFSTAESISDLSGRGVGMDVVRTAVESINGSVLLTSRAGKGTTITLSLPLSMAVSNVMVIEAAGRRFGVPMDLINETVRVHADDIHHFKQSQSTVLRGRVVPLRALNDVLAIDAAPQRNAEGENAVLVVRLPSGHVGLLVDQFHGASDIILKPLEGVLAGLTGFAGTALMGDGSVLMVLNPKELL